MCNADIFLLSSTNQRRHLKVYHKNITVSSSGNGGSCNRLLQDNHGVILCLLQRVIEKGLMLHCKEKSPQEVQCFPTGNSHRERSDASLLGLTLSLGVGGLCGVRFLSKC